MHITTAIAVLSASALLVIGGGTAAIADSAPPEAPTAADFEASLTDAAASDPVAAESLEAYDALSATRQAELIEILGDPQFVDEFLHLAPEVDPTPYSPEVAESEVYPDEVTYESEVDVQDGPDVVGLQAGFGFGAGTPIRYPANTTQTLTVSQSAQIFGITVTKLTIWVTFKTGTSGIPVKALSSGASAVNINVFVQLSNSNAAPFISNGLAVAKTVWTGSVIVKDGAARFDKVQTLKAFNDGLYSYTLVNA